MKDSAEEKIEIHIIKNEKSTKYKISKGTSIAQALKSLGFFVPTVCGGVGRCGKCKIKISTPVSIDLDLEEKRLLDQNEINNGIRLACRIPVVDGMKIWVGEQADLMSLNTKDASLNLNYGCVSEKMGVAIDIGTTTIVLSLVGLSTGIVLSTESSVNPQIVNGADVISRIAYAGDNPSRLKEMQGMVVSTINRLIESALKKADCKKNAISKAAISGNTVMLHLFLGLNVQSLGTYPYETNFAGALKKTSRETGLNIADDGEIWILPSISAFLGADIVSGILATKMHESEKMSILIDLGTNGEIAGGNKYKMVGCSTAAGPAFEGASIKCGSICSNGAIDKVLFNGKDVSYTTIGNIPPKSICGSGILDITAVLLEIGIVLQNGRMLNNNQAEEKFELGAVASRVKEYEGTSAFLISEGESEIVFTQGDVRKVQLAKSAAVTGVMMVMKKLNIDYEDIDKLYIAGNFGTFLNIENAVKIGLIPKHLKDKIITVGNSSVKGAVECLLDADHIEECSKIQELIEYFDIGSAEGFQEIYVQNLDF